MHFNNREEIIALTPQWTGERLPDGRPKVADRYLDALADMTLEEVWKPIFVKGAWLGSTLPAKLSREAMKGSIWCSWIIDRSRIDRCLCPDKTRLL